MNVKINILKGGALMAREIIFYNLEAELLRAKLNKAELAAKINILLLALPLIKDIVTIAGELTG